ncbi:hypothetical protein AAMO2058_001401300 [Amorphochlora amoebiformis]
MGQACRRPSDDLGILVLVSKFPTPKKSKTRLGKHIGYKESAQFAHAGLVDLLHRFHEVKGLKKVLLYAPIEAESKFKSLLNTEQLTDSWRLLPMGGGDNDPTATDLGDRLKQGLIACRRMSRNPLASVCFIGSDCPDITPEHLKMLFRRVNRARGNSASILPAADGGYVALALSAGVPATVFDDVLWSDPMTFVSQLQALSRNEVSSIHVGDTLTDIDNIEDIRDFHRRLSLLSTEERLSHGYQRTWAALMPFADTLTYRETSDDKVLEDGIALVRGGHPDAKQVGQKMLNEAAAKSPRSNTNYSYKS